MGVSTVDDPLQDVRDDGEVGNRTNASLRLLLLSGFSGQMRRASSGHWRSAAL